MPGEHVLTAATYKVYLVEVVAFQVSDKGKPVAWFNNGYFSLTQV